VDRDRRPRSGSNHDTSAVSAQQIFDRYVLTAVR
jgi:hypothetical protein